MTIAYNVASGVHVWASKREVIRAARATIKKPYRLDRKYRSRRRAFYREVLKHHADHQKLCRRFAL